MINNGLPRTLGAGAKARSAEPCERLLAASLGGRAAWPTGRLLAVLRQGAVRGRAAWPRPRQLRGDWGGRIVAGKRPPCARAGSGNGTRIRAGDREI